MSRGKNTAKEVSSLRQLGKSKHELDITVRELLLIALTVASIASAIK